MSITIPPITLLIVDDHQMIIDGLSTILETADFVAKIYTAANGREAVELALSHQVDCVIMDINMPVLNGLEATRMIKKEARDIKVIVLSMLSDASIVSKMLKAGADAFINKDTGKAELMNAIRKVMQNERYISPAIADNYFMHLRNPGHGDAGPAAQLTPRETEIIRYIAEGLTNAEIARRLFLSTVTVDTHRKNILAKLQVKNSAALVKYAADHHLL